MPVMGAKQAMERMLENSPPPRVVIVTMYDDPRLVRELIGLGAVAYLVRAPPWRNCRRRFTPPQTAQPGQGRRRSRPSEGVQEPG